MIIFKENVENVTTNTNDNAAERVEANVKWYNPTKGYGFLTRDDDAEDIMIHFSVLDKVGCPYVKEGDRVICDIGSGGRGLQVIRVIEVKYESPEPRSLSSFVNPRVTPVDPENLEEIEGVIKWFNPIKGYGFILSDEGREEIFVHYSVIRAIGYKFLEPGTRVFAKVSYSERGPEAHTIRVLCEEEGGECPEIG